ncbi:hypothetical protein OH76DRAFT_1404104 [Lentinus brumalis]|uniref:Fungal pheromone STE3G-protein-coupled receptor n=1 Tax=Lentinus brumalis TaxID=2498619 RepID=A0A371D8P9_9APHY|nr:hypothetical protein OH76DRAFT_1404104 [Polyporus brumalis]
MSTSPPTSIPMSSPSTVNYTVDPALNLLLIGTVWSSFLVPIAIALFFFSDARMRRQPIFILNTCAIGLGLAVGAINIYNITRSISGRNVDPSITTVLTALWFLTPISVQAILLFRVVAAYPPRLLNWNRRFLIYGPFIVLLIARLINASICVAKIAQGVHTLANTFLASQLEWDLPYPKVEWFLQLFYDTYASTLFLLRLGEGRKVEARLGGDDTVTTDVSRNSYAERLRTLFWIAVSNFVFPVMLNIAQIIFIFRDRNFIHGTYITMVNNYVEIIGVLLATLWCSGTKWQGSDFSRRASDTGPIVFGPSESMGSVKFTSPSILESHVPTASEV